MDFEEQLDIPIVFSSATMTALRTDWKQDNDYTEGNPDDASLTSYARELRWYPRRS